MNRRCFLSGAAAFAASRPWRLFAETGESQPMALDVAGATPDLRFGVVSDVHVREATGQYGTEALVRGPFDGKDRKGRASKQIEVSFPAATAGDGRPRAYDYEVAAEVEESGARRIAKSKRVYSPTYFLAPEREIGTVRCVFSVNELGTRKAKWFNPKVRFVVRAAESFGNPGRTLASNWHQL